MLTNREFNRQQGFAHDFQIPAEFEPFAAFTLELPDGTPLWEVTPRREGMTLVESIKFEAEQKELDRQARLALYIQRGFAFDERAVTDPQGGEDEYDPNEGVENEDEWTEFFASDRKPRDRGGRRHTRESHNSFEGLVDRAQ